MIIPPDSMRDDIEFPDSLYNIGIFFYATVNEENMISGDTLKIFEVEEGFNLFNIINSFPSNGFFGTYQTKSYFADSNTVFEGDETFNKMLFETPLKINSRYSNPNDTIKIIDTIQVSLDCGNFTAIRIERIQLNDDSTGCKSTLYFVTGIGIVLLEQRGYFFETDPVTGQDVEVEIFSKRVLTGYE
jgi:hypothetical protein